jgi:hypothetical protein
MVQIHLSSLAAVIIFGLALAAPTDEPDYIVEEAKLRPHTVLRDMFKRELYTDGEGTYINSDSVHHYASGVKCWTDYFLVSQHLYSGPWERASGDIYCTGTSSCEVAQLLGTQHCTTTTLTLSSTIGDGMDSLALAVGYDIQNCNTASDTTYCTWTDGNCHVVWTQPQWVAQSGYERRRCSSDSGDYTAWMQDFERDSPTSQITYGCGSSCGDTNVCGNTNGQPCS